MNVHSAVRRKVNDVLAQQVSVRDDDADLRFQRTYGVQKRVAARALRLKYGDRLLIGDAFYGRGDESAAMARVGCVRLRDDTDDVMPFA